MIHDLKPYPSYKNSGVSWLGEVPEHWELKRGKNLFCCVDVRSETGEEDLLTVSSEHGVVPRRSATVTMFKAESYVGHKLCWPGDLVINSLWAWARGLGASQYHGIVSTAYGVYRPRKGADVDSRFIHDLVRSTPFQWELQVRSKGVWTSRLQLTDDSFLGAPFSLPPFTEQSAIVRFLDYVDRRIRRYIRAKKKLIELLNEQKQAIIHRAVTRGLDPNARLKPSGVEWLGDVPEHWEVLSLGSASLSIQTGPFGSQLHASDYVPGGIPVINPSHMCNGIIHADPKIAISEGKAAELQRHTLQINDVVVARRGELGRCALVVGGQEGWLCGTGSLRLRLRHEVFNAAYLVHLLGSSGVRDTLSLFSIGATMDNLNASMVARLRIPTPPLQEQSMIMNWISYQTRLIESAAFYAKREISLLREYRTRLIADVVTGKLDVREAAAGLPEFDLGGGEDEPDGSNLSDRADQEGESGADDEAHGMEEET